MAEGLAFGCFQDIPFRAAACRGRPSPEHGRLLAALFTAPHGEVSHFTLNAKGFPMPVFLDSGPAQRNFHHLHAIFAGAEAYCTEALSPGRSFAVRAALGACGRSYAFADAGRGPASFWRMTSRPCFSRSVDGGVSQSFTPPCREGRADR